MYKRLPKEWKVIADAHIKACMNKQFDDVFVSNDKEIYAAMREGKTFTNILEEIEIRYCSMTSIMTFKLFAHVSESYKRGIYKGFLRIANEELLIKQ